MDSRFCYRNKNSGKDPEELRRKGEPAVRAKARLVILAFRDPDKAKLHRDSPTASRLSFFLLTQISLSLEFYLVSGDATSAFMQGGEDNKREAPLYMRAPRNGQLPGVSR